MKKKNDYISRCLYIDLNQLLSYKRYFESLSTNEVILLVYYYIFYLSYKTYFELDIDFLSRKFCVSSKTIHRYNKNLFDLKYIEVINTDEICDGVVVTNLALYTLKRVKIVHPSFFNQYIKGIEPEPEPEPEVLPDNIIPFNKYFR